MSSLYVYSRVWFHSIFNIRITQCADFHLFFIWQGSGANAWNAKYLGFLEEWILFVRATCRPWATWRKEDYGIRLWVYSQTCMLRTPTCACNLPSWPLGQNVFCGWDIHGSDKVPLKELKSHTVSELVNLALLFDSRLWSWRSKYFGFGKNLLLWSIRKCRYAIFYEQTSPFWLAGSEAHI